jgi:hypothetical protein
MKILVPVDCRTCCGNVEIGAAVAVLGEDYSEDWAQWKMSSLGLWVLQECSQRLHLHLTSVSSLPFDLHGGFLLEHIPCSPVGTCDRAERSRSVFFFLSTTYVMV